MDGSYDVEDRLVRSLCARADGHFAVDSAEKRGDPRGEFES